VRAKKGGHSGAENQVTRRPAAGLGEGARLRVWEGACGARARERARARGRWTRALALEEVEKMERG